MDRRDLLANLFQLRRETLPTAQMIPVAGGIEQHTDPLTLPDVLHLLRRVGFGATMTQANGYVGKTALEVVNELLGTTNEASPQPPGVWVDQTTEDPDGADQRTRAEILATWDKNMTNLSNWWFDLMRNDDKTVEKLSLFWTSHWTSEYKFDLSNSIPQTLYRQYLMLRKNRIGGLREMALEATLDNCMLFYLGGTLNEVGKPNENYGRELMELFLLGIGWYTEGDVKEAARVLTGWKSQRFVDAPSPNGYYNTYFDPVRHDIGTKQFLGETIPARTGDSNTEFQVRNEEVFELIKIIFRARPEPLSRFIASKVYRYFVYSSGEAIDPLFLEDLAKAFRDSDFDLKSLFVALFTSKHFFDPALRGAQIKTPIEFVAGMMRQLKQGIQNPFVWAGAMDQAVMDPPNVAGWPGYRQWISTNTYPQRRNFANTLIAAMDDNRVNGFIREFDDYTDVHKFTANVVTFLLPVPVSPDRLSFYEQAILQGAPDYDWSSILNTPTSAAARVRNLLTTISKAPDFQLC